MKIAIYNPSSFGSIGGAERFCTNLANWLIQRCHQVFVITTQGHLGRQATYPFDAHVQIIYLAPDTRLLENRAYLKKLGPDVLLVLSHGQNGLAGINLCYDTGIPLIMSEHNKPDFLNKNLGSPLNRNATLLGADFIHILCHAYKRSIPEFLHARVRVIPNSVQIPEHTGLPPDRRKLLLAVGRLRENQKNLSLLLRAFSLLAAEFPDWHLTICGDGPAMGLYKKMAKTLNISSRVTLPGVIAELAPIYDTASIFCMPSRFEGMPIALLEAQSHGLPAVGFADCTGVNELIADGVNGFLVGERSGAALANALARLMADQALREAMGAAAKKTILAYDESAIFPIWEELLREAASHKSETALAFSQFTQEEQAIAGLKCLVSNPVEFLAPTTE